MANALVRIKPYNARKGDLLKTFTFRGFVFKEEHGWHEVDPDVAEYLETATTDGNPDSRLVFDVAYSEAEARRIEDRAKAAVTRATAQAPHRVSYATNRSAETAIPRGAPPGSSGDLTLEEVNPRAARLDARKFPLTVGVNEGLEGIAGRRPVRTTEEGDEDGMDGDLSGDIPSYGDDAPKAVTKTRKDAISEAQKRQAEADKAELAELEREEAAAKEAQKKADADKAKADKDAEAKEKAAADKAKDEGEKSTPIDIPGAPKASAKSGK